MGSAIDKLTGATPGKITKSSGGSAIDALINSKPKPTQPKPAEPTYQSNPAKTPSILDNIGAAFKTLGDIVKKAVVAPTGTLNKYLGNPNQASSGGLDNSRGLLNPDGTQVKNEVQVPIGPTRAAAQVAASGAKPIQTPGLPLNYQPGLSPQQKVKETIQQSSAKTWEPDLVVKTPFANREFTLPDFISRDYPEVAGTIKAIVELPEKVTKSLTSAPGDLLSAVSGTAQQRLAKQNLEASKKLYDVPTYQQSSNDLVQDGMDPLLATTLVGFQAAMDVASILFPLAGGLKKAGTRAFEDAAVGKTLYNPVNPDILYKPTSRNLGVDINGKPRLTETVVTPAGKTIVSFDKKLISDPEKLKVAIDDAHNVALKEIDTRKSLNTMGEEVVPPAPPEVIAPRPTEVPSNPIEFPSAPRPEAPHFAGEPNPKPEMSNIDRLVASEPPPEIPQTVPFQAQKEMVKELSKSMKAAVADYLNGNFGENTVHIESKIAMDKYSRLNYDRSFWSAVKNSSFYKKEGGISDRLGSATLMSKNGRRVLADGNLEISKYGKMGYKVEGSVNSRAAEAGFEGNHAGQDYLHYLEEMSNKKVYTKPEQVVHDHLYKTDANYKNLSDTVDNLKAEIIQYEHEILSKGQGATRKITRAKATTNKGGAEPPAKSSGIRKPTEPNAATRKPTVDTKPAGDGKSVPLNAPEKLPSKPKPTSSAATVKKNKFVERVSERIAAEYPEIMTESLTTPMKQRVESEKAIALVERDPKEAYRIAMGGADARGFEAVHTNIALAEQALREGNDELFAQLTKYRSFEQTERGRAIVSEKASVTDNSVSRYMKELLSQRLERLGNRTAGLENVKGAFGSPAKAAMGRIKAEVARAKKVVGAKSFDLEAAQKLIDDLTCK